MTDFFITYNSADRHWAEWIAWQLEEAGYTTTLQAWDFRPGSNFVLEMQRAATEAERTISVLSPDYLAARYTQPEWAAAFARDPTGEKGDLVPVRVRECALEGLLPQIIYIDLVGLDAAGARERLLIGVQRGRAKPAAPVSFPGAERTVPHQPSFPGAMPPVWNIPHHRNPTFTGREDLLLRLRSALAGGNAPVRPQALTGLGGVGKTQLVTEYAYRNSGDYDQVWWIRAEEPGTLASDFASLAAALRLPEAEAPDQRETREAVRRWLEQSRRWLLVFDNAPGPSDVREYVPRGGSGHVLITSRNPNWGDLAGCTAVPILPESDSVALLLRRTGEPDETAAADLARELGYLPLALQHAGSYLAETGTSIPSYLRLFQDRALELFKEGSTPPDYSGTVLTTWDLAFRRVVEELPAAGDLMRLSAFLAPDAIPIQVLREAARMLPDQLRNTAADQLQLNRVLAVLRRYSLIESMGDSFSVHRLVQAVVRTGLTDAEQVLWADSAGRMVAVALPVEFGSEPDDVRAWSTCAQLLPHMLAVAHHLERLVAHPLGAAYLFLCSGIYLRSRAEFQEALSLLERALAIQEAAYGRNHPAVAKYLGNLGLLKQAARTDLKGARDLFARTLEIDESRYGQVHPEVARDLGNLANALLELGELSEARQAYERALGVLESVYGPKHPDVARTLGNLGHILYRLGELDAAKQKQECALELLEVAYGPEYPEVVRALNNLGATLRQQGDLAAARQRFERALAICQALYGSKHPAAVLPLMNLGSLLHQLGNGAGARAMLERALAIQETAYGPESPDVAVTVHLLIDLVHELDDLGATRELLERAVGTFQSVYGPDDPRVAQAQGNLGTVLRELGDLRGAQDAYEQGLAVAERAYGPNHPEVARLLRNFGLVLEGLGDRTGARTVHERALRIFEATLGENHAEVGTTLFNLGTALSRLGELSKARAVYERALRIQEAAHSPVHPDVARTLCNLGFLLYREREFAKAREALDRALQIIDTVSSQDKTLTRLTVSNLFMVLIELGDSAAIQRLQERLRP